MADVQLGEQELNPDEKVKYYISNFKGNDYLHIRTYWMPEGDEKFVPTKKGTSVCLSDNNIVKEQLTIHENIVKQLKEMLKE